MGGVPLILESLVPFEREMSVIAARGLDGCGIALRSGSKTCTATASCTRRRCRPLASPATRRRPRRRRRPILDRARLCRRHRRRVLRAGGWRRWCQRDRAARPQFRALDRGGLRRLAVRAAYPRRSPACRSAIARRHSDCVMENLCGFIGDDVARVPDLLARGRPRAAPLRQGRGPAVVRKMGHFTRLSAAP
jgi:5-(carboxyamino)imidazole ribonucleotide synthase